MFGGINRLGIFGGPAIGGMLADQAGIHATFGLSAALAGLALAMSAILLKPCHGPRWRCGHLIAGVWWEPVCAATRATCQRRQPRRCSVR